MVATRLVVRTLCQPTHAAGAGYGISGRSSCHRCPRPSRHTSSEQVLEAEWASSDPLLVSPGDDAPCRSSSQSKGVGASLFAMARQSASTPLRIASPSMASRREAKAQAAGQNNTRALKVSCPSYSVMLSLAWYTLATMRGTPNTPMVPISADVAPKNQALHAKILRDRSHLDIQARRGKARVVPQTVEMLIISDAGGLASHPVCQRTK
mmetsp:Transcript_13473/g.37295  ORF Transcript_13473/g.37295 Transcript_13473/m.37295 type:complete len:209 (+) Transcript_13473:50-676(+)